VVRIRTTGGGGWGDPLDRPIEEVVRDVLWGKVSAEGARVDYGVVLASSTGEPVADVDATDALREQMRADRGLDEPFFDRGPGYERLSGGAKFAEFDFIDR